MVLFMIDLSMGENRFGIFEVTSKGTFSGASKKIIDIIRGNKQCFSEQTDNVIKLKENHNYYYQVQGFSKELCSIEPCGIICFLN